MIPLNLWFKFTNSNWNKKGIDFVNRYIDNVEAQLEEYESFLTNPHNSSMKRSKSPFSLPTGLRYHPTGDIHNSKRGSTSGQHQSSKNEYSEELQIMLMDLINSGLTDENTEICDKNTYRKENCTNDEQVWNLLISRRKIEGQSDYISGSIIRWSCVLHIISDHVMILSNFKIIV